MIVAGLTVNQDTTTTTITATTDSATYGDESAVVFSVQVTTTNPASQSELNGETVTVNVGSASCIVTLDATGFGSCSIGNTDLAVGGPYSVSASYAGDSNLQG